MVNLHFAMANFQLNPSACLPARRSSHANSNSRTMQRSIIFSSSHFSPFPFFLYTHPSGGSRSAGFAEETWDYWLYCCPLRRSGSTTSGPTENRAIVYWSPLSPKKSSRLRKPRISLRPRPADRSQIPNRQFAVPHSSIRAAPFPSASGMPYNSGLDNSRNLVQQGDVSWLPGLE